MSGGDELVVWKLDPFCGSLHKPWGAERAEELWGGISLRAGPLDATTAATDSSTMSSRSWPGSGEP